MAQPLRPKTTTGRVKDNQRRIRNEQRKPNIPGPYIYVSGGTGGTSALETWQSVPWKNGWDFVTGFDVAFRHGLDGLCEFTGVVDSSGATSGTVAFTLPVPWRPFVEFSFITDLDLGAGDFDAARVVVQTDGDVVIYFPLTA